MKAEKTDEGLSISMAAEQPVDRKVMPYYTSIRLKKPVTIPGKAKALLAELEAVLMPSRRARAERKPAEKKD